MTLILHIVSVNHSLNIVSFDDIVFQILSKLLGNPRKIFYGKYLEGPRADTLGE